ncbi:hypothetical protein MJO47_09350 [Desulfuromonas sp. KJ2020]|uniref:glycoside hydrolase family 108 protein n=1 Tax=Desulfuromonas sp. KJ2020 TaxID=2919173 RepID=UPI0020A74C97|nr:glycosyl hydrolase 108 family protein [Desulfuromonas sp. KJ2020]MCP3177303.1 hypothetical protein [Desulfuromonas sp. KJ2020]
MSAFTQALNHTLNREGGYSNHPSDLGGETFRGISRRNHPEWEGWAILDSYPADKRKELQGDPELAGLVAQFYRVNYWDQLSLDGIEATSIACELFDTAVNVGTTRAARWLQHVANLLGDVNLVEDGKIGPKTLEAVNALNRKLTYVPMLKALNGMQFEHYHQIILNNSSQRVFFRGWLTRVWEWAKE